jgi:hypothetical protein
MTNMRLRLLTLLLAAALSLAGAHRAAAMTFEAIADPAECPASGCILANGDIDATSADQLERFLVEHKVAHGALLVLDSPGGALIQSLELGNVVRGAGLATTVRAYDAKTARFRAGGECASACVYAFLGGVERTAGEGARIGVHQPYTAGDTWALSAQDGFSLMTQVAVHVKHLCGSLELLIPAMRTPPQQMHWFTQSELTRYAVITRATPNA